MACCFLKNWILILITMLWISASATAAILHVPADFSDIKSALAQATDGDTISVASGIYTEPGNTNLEIPSRQIVLMGESGAENTIIDCQWSGFAFRSLGDRGAGITTEIRGFTFTHAYSEFGAIQANSRIKISLCRFNQNEGLDSGGAITGKGSPWIVGCIFAGNSSLGSGGACAFQHGAPLFDRCTFWGNTALTGGQSLSLIQCRLMLVNCILWDPVPVSENNTFIDCRYCDVMGGVPQLWQSEGCISADPLFQNPAQGDFTLLQDSPCLHTGDPRSRLNVDGSRANIGADQYGGDLPAGILGGTISGIIDSHSTHTVTETLIIPTGKSLFISGDARLFFLNRAGILVHGKLNISSSGSEAVVMRPTDECSWFGGVQFIHSQPSELYHLTLSDGAGHVGGGMYGYDSRVVLLNSRIYHCWAGSYGGGIHFNSASPLIINTVIHDNQVVGNSAEGGRGGGAAFRSCAVNLSGCHVYRNSATSYGAGLYSDYYSQFNGAHLTIESNFCMGSEAGIASHQTALWDCLFYENHAMEGIGGLWFFSGTIAGCRFINNSAGEVCGGFSSQTGKAGLCLVEGNAADAGGGVYVFSGANIGIHSSTFADNLANEGGALYISSNSQLHLANSVVWNNGDELATVTGDVKAEYCDVRNGSSEPWFGEGCIDSDPLFVNGPDGQWYLSQMSAGQPDDSPCLNQNAGISSGQCFDVSNFQICLDELTTRTDDQIDSGSADMGFHYFLTPRPVPTALPFPVGTGIMDSTPTPTPTPWTPAPTPTETVTPPATITPPECSALNIQIHMPGRLFFPGSTCYLRASICSPVEVVDPLRLVAVLELGEVFYFYPGWAAQADFEEILPHPGEYKHEIIAPFTWPDDAGCYDFAIFWAGIFGPDSWNLQSNVSRYTFSWCE